jgi:hypothetical protein
MPVSPEPRNTPDGGTIIAEVFADRDGRPVPPDSPELASIEVTVAYPDGRVERTYIVRAEGPPW